MAWLPGCLAPWLPGSLGDGLMMKRLDGEDSLDRYSFYLYISDGKESSQCQIMSYCKEACHTHC